MTRTVLRVLATATLAASLASAGTAVAAPPSTDPGPPSAVPAAPAFRALSTSPTTTGVDVPTAAPPRTIHSEVVRDDEDRMWLRGKVEDYRGRGVAVQRKRCETCSWRLHEVVRTTKGGQFRSGIRAPRRGSTFWRAAVARSDGYARSYSAVWETYYRHDS